ncbi:hypothetical protein TSUD_298450 [Trifolium subterraneum]|nr:hypothetical protein TSUD_298450 [Trifolium subterraneum]
MYKLIYLHKLIRINSKINRQTAFVKDRQILDDILIANEAVDEACKFQKELLLFKVDFEKAYDSVDWGYLDAVMGRMSFPFLWRKWIKECVCSATASILVNGSPTDEFPLERGLRQGDPFSPFLFLLAAEGLNVLMKAMVESNVFTGYTIRTAENPLYVSHLQFADHTLLLGVKSWANIRALRDVLVLFELMSGLKVNFHKSMLVGVNISDSWLSEAASVLRCRVGKVPFLYLGLPIGGDPSRLGFWEPVVARIKQRLSGWKSRFLSFGGRLILLKVRGEAVEGVQFGSSRYGEERGSLCEGGRRGSSWWREIARIREGVGGSGGWFGDCVSKKSSTVAEMSSLGWEVGGNAWVWQRQLWVWEEEMLRKCQTLLHDFSLQAQYHDRWQWQPDLDGEELIWHKQVPLNVSIFAWRLLRDRLPTKANLVFVYGSASRQQTLITYRTISFSLLTLPAVFVLDDLFYSSSGLLVYGLYELNEISASLETQSVPYLNFWTRSNSSLIGD